MAAQSDNHLDDYANPSFADAALLERCFAGDVAGWESLYLLCQRPIQASIRQVLGHRAKDRDLVEELTAQVWYALVDGNAARLASFQAERSCRLTTYVASVAKNIVRNFLRSDRRRRAREADLAIDSSGCQEVESNALGLVADELRATLSERESGFFDWCMMANASISETFSGSENADHQLRHRLRRKVRKFFDC